MRIPAVAVGAMLLAVVALVSLVLYYVAKQPWYVATSPLAVATISGMIGYEMHKHGGIEISFPGHYEYIHG